MLNLIAVFLEIGILFKTQKIKVCNFSKLSDAYN